MYYSEAPCANIFHLMLPYTYVCNKREQYRIVSVIVPEAYVLKAIDAVIQNDYNEVGVQRNFVVIYLHA